ncbi:MAG: hypothetical protein KDE51_06275, partial [Anaerolineales bacterium]|nr:hypothetical protein [Anaerolineales bacterium]
SIPTVIATAEEVPTATAISIPTVIATAEEVPTATATLVPTNTPIPTNTLPPTPTATSVVNFAPSLTPIPTWTPAPTAVAMMVPGDVIAGELQPNVANIHYFEGERFETVFFLARGSDELDLALVAYELDALAAAQEAQQTLPETLASLSPNKLVEDTEVGQPEFMIYTPQSDSLITVGLGGINGTSGRYKLYMFDTVTTTVNTPLVQTDTVAAGQTNRYPLASRGARPVVVFVDPVGNVDVKLLVKDGNGNVIVSSDFGRAGSPEAAFVRPGTAVEYTVEVSSATAATYNIVLVAITDDVD